jgi:hypothetical protein
MMKLKIAICILLGILFIIFTPNIFEALPVLSNLFTDNINYILIMLVVIFIMLIDVYFGTTLALVILYMAMYINNNTNITIKKNIMFPMKTLPNSMQILPPNTNIINNKVIMSKSDNTNTIRDDSEFIYDNTKPFPNNNLKPFQPKDYDSKTENSNSQINVNSVQQTINQECSNDRITKVEQPDRSGYDVTGCRYDMKNSPQNLTQYGPPLAQCSAYDPAKAQICGTVFYPLNA